MITKTLKLADAQLKMDGDTGRFSGYASVFGGVDVVGDTIENGAFAETLVNHGSPKMFYNHVWDMPIGKYEAYEDEIGLFVKGELTPGLALASDVLAGMKHGTIDGLSIGGFLKKGDYTETKTGRVIHKWSKLVEVSPVVFPADGNARIDLSSVKHIDFESLLPACDTEKDIERLLRDAGLLKEQATAIVSRVRAILKGRDALERQDEQILAIAARLERLAA